jgi:glycerate dehydrogenase
VRIVVLDGFALNPGDLSWDELRQLGDCEIFDRSTGHEIRERSQAADILLTNKTPLDRATIESLAKLKYIGVLATGYNIVDVQAASENSVVVSNIPTYGTSSVAQHVFALLLELTQRAGHHADTVRQGRWSKNPDWSYWDFPLVELEGLTFGIVGFGRIGQNVAKLAKAFGMELLVYQPQFKNPLTANVQSVDLETLFARSDVVSLHCPLTKENEAFVNRTRLGLMKPTAFLINTSRGRLIHEQDLADILNEERIAGAGLDVLSTEPPSPDNPLLSAKNCIVTPHIAWATLAARRRLMRIAIENVRAFLAGQPVNTVQLAK